MIAGVANVSKSSPLNETVTTMVPQLTLFRHYSSYHCKAEVAKCWIIYPSIGNVSWVYTIVRQS